MNVQTEQDPVVVRAIPEVSDPTNPFSQTYLQQEIEFMGVLGPVQADGGVLTVGNGA